MLWYVVVMIEDEDGVSHAHPLAGPFVEKMDALVMVAAHEQKDDEHTGLAINALPTVVSPSDMHGKDL